MPLNSLFRRQTVSAGVNGKPNGVQREPRVNGQREENATSHTPQSSEGSSLNILREFRDHVKSSIPVPLDLSALGAVVDAIRHTEAIDDRKFLLEHALTFTSKLEPGRRSQALQNKIVQLLYNDLPHPPATSIGTQYAWRSADGAFNNPHTPDMGKAGTPYARSVQQSHSLPKNELPDPGLIFDSLLKRDGFVKHPAGLSSLMFSFAALVIHTVFRTSHDNVNVNETSSYVDLSPLYGHNQAAQDLVRKRNGRGLLFPDVFAEDRLLLLPPAVCTLLVLFSRNHNYIAAKLLEINEKGSFADPVTLDEAARHAQDEELFQTARLVNCGWFASVVFSDYFSAILGLVRQGSSWSLDPFGEIRNADHSTFERGQGNVCSVEFNCLYRWHATTSEDDERWVDQVFANIFDGKAPDQVTPHDFKSAAKKVQSMQPDITHWTFGNMQRQEDGSFDDNDLARVIHTATDHPAGAFRARGTPASMRLHEMMGIEQNRRWGVCSLNDFRKYLGLKPYETFLEWNSNPEIASVAEKLYGDIERLELYVGLQAEEAKPVMDGAGLCPGYTISRAILSDAIALTRGDRFFTYDYTPFNLTAWGFADCQRDPGAFGFGSTLGRLFHRTLPRQFTENSVYAFFPLMTPRSMKVHLKKLEVIDKYDLTKPTPIAPTKIVNGFTEVKDILTNDGLHTVYSARSSKVIKGEGFVLVENEKEMQKLRNAIIPSQAAKDNILTYFRQKTRELILSNSILTVGSKVQVVDLVRDVLKVVPVLWVATELVGIELKTSTSSDGACTVAELYDMIGCIYEYVFLQPETGRLAQLQEKAADQAETLVEHIKSANNVVRKLTSRGSIAGLAHMLSISKKNEDTGSKGGTLGPNLRRAGFSSDEEANAMLAAMVGASVELSLSITNVVNKLLGGVNDLKAGAAGLFEKAKASGADFSGEVREALRLDPTFAGIIGSITPGSPAPQEERVILDLATAGRDGLQFPQPDQIDPSRPADKYLPRRCVHDKLLGEDFSTAIIAEVVKTVFSFDGLRRAPGQSGILKRFKSHDRPELGYAYLNHEKFACPWPTSMSVQFNPLAKT